jgi:hypothetical protein
MQVHQQQHHPEDFLRSYTILLHASTLVTINP